MSDSPASFNAVLDRLVTEMRPDDPAGTVWEFNNKLAGRALAERLGLPVPRIVAGPSRISRIDPPTAPGVLKPVDGCAGWGVVPFILTDDGRYERIFTGEVRTWKTIVARAVKSWRRYQPGSSLPPWIVEELMRNTHGDLVDDVKCYAIGGRIELIRQRRPGRGRSGKAGAVHCFWSRSWDRLPRVDIGRHTAELPIPDQPAAIVHGAERIARHLFEHCGTPFVRVDMYPGGIFGEITPEPGGDQFGPIWDRVLAESWLAATERAPH